MSIKIHIHPNLFGYTKDIETAEVDGKTVGECLQNLIELFPGLDKGLFMKKKIELQPVFDIWINDSSAFPNELEKPVKDGDEVYITTVIADG